MMKFQFCRYLFNCYWLIQKALKHFCISNSTTQDHFCCYSASDFFFVINFTITITYQSHNININNITCLLDEKMYTTTFIKNTVQWISIYFCSLSSLRSHRSGNQKPNQTAVSILCTHFFLVSTTHVKNKTVVIKITG